MAGQKIVELIEKLHKATVAGRVQWKRTQRDRVYQASFPDYSLQISARDSRKIRNARDYVLEIYDCEELLVEEIADPDVDGFIHGVKAYELMKEIYEHARRQAEGIDRAIDSILGDL